MYGTFVWAHRALSSQKRWFPARAVFEKNRQRKLLVDELINKANEKEANEGMKEMNLPRRRKKAVAAVSMALNVVHTVLYMQRQFRKRREHRRRVAEAKAIAEEKRRKQEAEREAKLKILLEAEAKEAELEAKRKKKSDAAKKKKAES